MEQFKPSTQFCFQTLDDLKIQINECVSRHDLISIGIDGCSSPSIIKHSMKPRELNLNNKHSKLIIT